MKNLIIAYQVEFNRLEKYAEALLEKQEFQSTYYIETSRTNEINYKRRRSCEMKRAINLLSLTTKSQRKLTERNLYQVKS